ncbi:MAG: Smr/MutS family protein, partial [Anaerovoracaceae bacterium]|nr:Smr/MutS family protein [Anaerovoracaceae bacterium]
AALAIAILESLMEKGASVAATTHYNELKKFAIEREGVQNASMEFNVETLSPTYRLIIGTPGKSNAFEISRKLGLDQKIIDRADHLIERGDLEFEDVLSKIEHDRKSAENDRAEAERALREIQEKEAKITRRLELLDKHENEVLEKARKQARDIVDDANRTVDEVREELKELAKEESLGERNKRLDSGRKKLKEVKNKYSSVEIKEVNNNPVSVNELKPGDRVKILSVGEIAEVLEIPSGDGPLLVQAGPMKMRIKPEDLMLVQGGPKGVNQPKKSIYERRTGSGGGTSGIYRTKAMQVSSSVNVIGKNLDDAVEDVSKYLDDAYVAGLKEVTVIHGRGQGILQNGLRNLFKSMPTVASFRRGNYNEGGDGVTIVKFRE